MPFLGIGDLHIEVLESGIRIVTCGHRDNKRLENGKCRFRNPRAVTLSVTLKKIDGVVDAIKSS
jgi:hypothetical protein